MLLSSSVVSMIVVGSGSSDAPKAPKLQTLNELERQSPHP